ncbi:MAG TPA: saccharopine dehydrogenase NADP-binding domain-containing protein, partial [Thermoplasmata archaeon]|nr:saccharopine dehydrogenase NADP-binding domain-containing protein [Thermoplasmata archaeon]
MRAVVLGGGGLTGRCTVRDLAEGGGFDEIQVADLDLALAEAAARATGSDVVHAELLDVRDPAALRRVLKGADVCVNAVQYTFNLAVMDGCLAEGVPYLDFGGLFHTTRRQLAQDARFRHAGLLAIPGLGQVPGVSNVLAMAAAQDLERVDTLVIRDGWRDLTPDGPEIVFTWSPSTFLDEMILEAMVFEEGEYRAHPPMSGGETYEFPDPVGTTMVYRTLHSEPATLPESLRAKGLRHCEWKEGGPGIDLLRTMAKLGLGSETPVEVHGQSVAPREFLLALLKREKLLGAPAGVTLLDWEVCDVEVRGRQDGKEVVRHALARFPPRPDWGFTATEYAVGVAGAIGARLIVEG